MDVSDKREVDKWKEEERGRGSERNRNRDSISGLSTQIYVGFISQQWILEGRERGEGGILEENLFSSVQFERPVEKERG